MTSKFYRSDMKQFFDFLPDTHSTRMSYALFEIETENRTKTGLSVE